MMERIVSEPVGKLIASEQGYELRYHDLHVLGFSQVYDDGEPVSAQWKVTDFGGPEQAKKVYPKLWDRINEICYGYW